MKILAITAAAISTGVLSLAAGCGSGHTTTSAGPKHSTAAAAPAPTPAGLSCSDISTDLATVLHDLKVSNRHYQEAWVSGGYGNSLQALINDTHNASSDGNQLTNDAFTFNADASGYLADNSPYLAPGWETGYNTVTTDIDAMATDCGMRTVKP